MSNPADHDFALAQQAFQQGDLGHALHHVGDAIATDPTRHEYLGLLDAILRRADDPLKLTAPDDEGHTDFGTAAARAYAFAMRGQWAEALSLLTDVMETRPDLPYLAWADGWLRQPGVGQLPPDVLMPNLIVPIVKHLPEAQAPDDPCLGNLRWASSILGIVRHFHPSLGFAWYASSVVMRRMRAFADAVPLARQGAAIEPCYLTSIGLACALRDADEPDAAIQAFHGARQYEPNEAAVFVDIGDIELGRERWSEAASAYEQALQLEPEHVWALSSRAFARWKRSDAAQDRDALLNLRDRFPRERRPQQLAQRLEPFEPFVTALPVPGDATSKPLVQILEMLRKEPAKAAGGKIDMNVSHPESPSVLMAFRLATAHVQPPVGVNLTVEKVQSPDPRVAKGQVDFAAWVYDGTTPRPNIGAPEPRVAEAVAAIAACPYGLARYAEAGQALGRQLAAGWIPQLVATMVNPPPPREQLDPFQWVQRVQIAAALTIAHVEEQAPWPASPRNRALTSLALGPVDWTASAAIVALAWLAKHDAIVRREVEPMLGWLETQIPKGSYTCFEYPLVTMRLWLGGLDAPGEERLRAWRDAIENGEGRDQQEEAEEAPAFDLEQEKAAARQAQQQLAQGGGDQDPVVFPGQKIARLSDYVGLMKLMQTGNMQGALAKYGLDMGSYVGVAQAWGAKLAGDPTLNALFAKQMANR